MGLNHSKPRLRKRRSASRSRRVRQNPDGVSSAVPSSQVNQSKFSPTSSLNECSNLVCPCKKQQDSEKNNEFTKSATDFASSPLRHRPSDVTKYVAMTKPGCDGMDEMVGLKVQLPPCSSSDNDHFDLSSITNRDIHKILLQHNSSNGKKKSSRRNKTSSSHHHHHHHRQSNAASAAADEYTLYFTDMGSPASRKELISRLTTSICGILDSRLEHLPSTKATTTESPSSSAIRLRLSVLPQDNTSYSGAEHKVAKNGDGVTSTTTRANDSDAPAFVRYYQRNDHRRSSGDVNCERQKHYHQIPGTDAALQQRGGSTTTTTRIDSSSPITNRCCHKKSSSTTTAALQPDLSTIPPSNQQQQRHHRNNESTTDDWKPRYNLGIKRMSEAWRRRVSPSDEKFYEIVNSRLREWQKQEDPGRAKRKGVDEGGGVGVEAEVMATAKSGARGRNSTTTATYQLIWPDDNDDSDDDETFQNNPASSSDSEYDGGDRDDDVAKRRGTANGGVLRMYQPLSERDIEAISCMGKAACIEVGATQANNLVAPPHPPHIIHDKQAKKRRHTFSFKRKPKAETAAHQSKEAADVPSASRHGYLRANSIDPGAPCPFPNTPGVTATPFALVPLSHKDIATSTAATLGGMQPVSLVVQRHCHEYVHHHHYYYPAKQS